MLRPRALVLLVSALALPACKSSDRAPASGEGPGQAAPGDQPAGSAAPAAAPGSALLKAEPITDGGAALPVYLDGEHVLHVGARTASVDRVDPDSNRHAWDSQAKLSVVDLEQNRKAVLLTTPAPGEEDPPNRYRLFLVEDGLPLAFDQVVGAYGMQELRVPGDGTVRYTEDGWTACERLEHPKVATRQEVVFRLDPATKKMAEAERTDTAQTMTCSELAACPHVYLVTDGGEILAGEILRDLRGADAYAQQSLPVPAGAGDTIRVRIAEQKQETTFLDEVYLAVDGAAVRPAACAASPAPAYCSADGVPHLMRQGDALELELPVPRGADRGSLELVARGYYVPTPTAHLRPAPAR